MSEEKIMKESGSSFVEYPGVPEIVGGSAKPMYFDHNNDGSPWLVDKSLLHKLQNNGYLKGEKPYDQIQEDYKEYHENFKKKSLLGKIGTLLWYFPSYLYYMYLAPSEDSQLYKSLNWFLRRSKERNERLVENV